jgi:hypothetical protein
MYLAERTVDSRHERDHRMPLTKMTRVAAWLLCNRHHDGDLKCILCVYDSLIRIRLFTSKRTLFLRVILNN